MGQDVNIVFIEEKKGFFKMGQEKKVKAGYAFNYLLPQNKAVLNNKENALLIKSLDKKTVAHQKELKKQATQTNKELNNQTINFKAKTHDEGKLYGSISINDVVSEINKNYEVAIDKHDFKDFSPIKEIGDYVTTISIHNDIETKLKIQVEEEIEEENKETKAAKEKRSKSSFNTYADEVDTPEENKKTDKYSSSTAPKIDDSIFLLDT